MTQREKAEHFLELHHGEKILVLINAWNPGTARLIEASGAKAIATTSMGVSASLGYADCQKIPVSIMTEAIRNMVEAVRLPVTADIEAGYGNNLPEIVASVQQLIETGIVGGNIEDSNHQGGGLMDPAEFCERIAAVRTLSDSLGFHFVINTRTDVFLNRSGIESGRMAETIRRANLYREAGADCIFVPDLWQRDDIATLVQEVDAPVNILVNPTNGTGLPPSVQELEQLGVARVSFGSSIMKSTLALTKKIAEEVLASGTYTTLADNLEPIPETVKAYQMATSV